MNKVRPVALAIAVVFTIACSTTPFLAKAAEVLHSKPPDCPDWVSHPVFGLAGDPNFSGHCLSDVQDVPLTKDEDTKIPFNVWNMGEIQLNNARITEVSGVVFYDSMGTVITDYSTMDRKMFYDFVVLQPGAYFTLALRDNPNPVEGQTHLRLAQRPE